VDAGRVTHRRPPELPRASVASGFTTRRATLSRDPIARALGDARARDRSTRADAVSARRRVGGAFSGNAECVREIREIIKKKIDEIRLDTPTVHDSGRVTRPES